MYQKRTVIKNVSGLHARPASDFIACAGKFSSKITIKRVGEEEDVNAKSIILLLSLGFGKGEEIELTANGDDEKQAVDTLIELIDSGFGE